MNECAVSSDLCTCASQEENPSCNATCINNDGSYQCQCSDGYYLFEGDTCIGKLFRKVFIKRFRTISQTSSELKIKEAGQYGFLKCGQKNFEKFIEHQSINFW